MTANPTPDAVRDADLVRWLDGELDAEDRRRIDEALAADPALANRLEQLRTRGERLRALLQATDEGTRKTTPPGTGTAPGAGTPGVIELNAAWAAQQGVEPHVVRPPRTVPGWLRVAAAIALLLAGSLLVPPVRALIADLFRPREAGRGGSGTAAAPAAVLIDTFGITFPTDAAALTVEFAAAPAAGTLTVERTDAAGLSAQVFRPVGGTEAFQRIRPDLLRLANSSGSRADYRVAVPPGVRVVIIRIPNRADAVWRFEPGQPERQVLQVGRPQG